MYPEEKWRELEEDEKNRIRREINRLIDEGDYDNPKVFRGKKPERFIFQEKHRSSIKNNVIHRNNKEVGLWFF